MLKSLKFVQGAVAKKDYNPALTHFSIRNGKIKGTNGSLTLCAPIPIDLIIKPKALPFVKAIQSCKGETVQLAVTPTGRLSIKAGKFKGLIECTEDQFPEYEPEGTWIALKDSILPAFKKLLDFTSEDASRVWSQGILLKGSKAYATNNVIAIEYDLGWEFPVIVNVPKTAIAEVVRVGQEPVGIMVAETSITFMYDKNHWIRTQLYELSWPDIEGVLNRESDQKEIPEGLFEAVETISPFVDDMGRILFRNGIVSTTSEEEEQAGASVEVEGITYEGVYNFKYLLKLQGIANTIDFTAYPKPCQFIGDNIKGVIMGMRT